MEDFRGSNLRNFYKTQFKTPKLVFLFVIFLAFLAIIAIFAFINVRNKTSEKMNLEKQQNQINDIIVPKLVKVSLKEVVEDFPSYLVLNAKIDVVESYSATYPNSPAQQAVVEFISSKSPEANFNFYTKWAEENGWNIVNASKGDLIFSIYLKKASERINMTIHTSAIIAKSSNIIIGYVNLNK